uniref:diphthine methyl ester synthase n=1 Tax=Ailuropoda melanoleuca TaxID=9646 RepID=A0A7N5KBL1_AILME
MLYLIGLGLGDAKDITVKGLEVVRRCSRVYLEAYTSILTVGKEVLEEFYGRKLILADREEVEQEADNILKDADTSDVAFLVVGDPFGATTHSDLILRATKRGISYQVIHNASIMSAVGCCGLQRNIICGKKIQDSEFLNLHGSFYTDLRIQLPLDGVASIDFLDSFQMDFGNKAHW